MKFPGPAAPASRYMTQVEEMERRAKEAIQLIFDLWWTGEPSKLASRYIRERIAASPVSDMDEALLQVAHDQLVDEYRQAAISLALDSQICVDLRRLSEQLQGELRDGAMQGLQEHKELMQKYRDMLREIGIDVAELERNFSPQSPGA